jgi:hypothetical protein
MNEVDPVIILGSINCVIGSGKVHFQLIFFHSFLIIIWSGMSASQSS